MKTVKYQSDAERSILTGMIVNHQVLSRIHASLKSEPKPFRDKWSNTIFKWCMDFYGKYEKAPQASLQAIFERWAEKTSDDATVGLVEKYLGSLSDDHKTAAEEINVDFLLDMAESHFAEVRFERLSEEISECVRKKDAIGAREKYAEFKPVSFATSAIVDVFTDESRMVQAFDEEEADILLKYPGPLGEFFAGQLQRDGLIAYLAPEKRGKSWWLGDNAYRAAALGKKRVLFFSAGDMSEKQMLRRYGIRAARHPKRAGEVKWPTSVSRNGDKDLVIEYNSNVFEHALGGKVAIEAFQKVMQRSGSRTSNLRMSCAPNSSLSVKDICNHLDECIREGWIPDVVVIDYADILAPEPGTSSLDTRDQIDATWKALRRMTQEYHVLGITATQSNSESYGASTLGRKNFTNDKRKFAHVTGMLGLNQTDDEKKLGVYRLNWIVLREEEYTESKCVTVAGNLALANPAMCSCW